MFLRQHGRQVLLLHSYRDGLGQVRQRCLARFRDREGLELHWGHLQREFPAWRPQLDGLRPKAEAMVKDSPSPPADAGEPLQRATRALLRLLSQVSLEDPRVVATVAPLRARLGAGGESRQDPPDDLERHRSAIKPGRTRLDAAELQSAPYLGALMERALHLRERGQKREALACLRERMQLCPDLESTSLYAFWQGGRRGACGALEKLAQADGARDYNLAALHFRAERYEEAVRALLQGIARRPAVAQALQRGNEQDAYWNRYGYLWGDGARKFLLKVAGLPQICHRLKRAWARGVRPRTLVRPFYQRALLLRVAGELGISLAPRRPFGCRPGSAAWQMQSHVQDG